ncbi:MAG: hypothetical protein HQK66_09570 [Desulfamplus sp.]|nr:hypothetical protein [Desulfamplus sp.]
MAQLNTQLNTQLKTQSSRKIQENLDAPIPAPAAHGNHAGILTVKSMLFRMGAFLMIIQRIHYRISPYRWQVGYGSWPFYPICIFLILNIGTGAAIGGNNGYFIEVFEEGIINWTTGVIESQGESAENEVPEGKKSEKDAHDYLHSRFHMGPHNETKFRGISDRTFIALSGIPYSIPMDDAILLARKNMVKILDRLSSGYDSWVVANGHSMQMLKDEIEKKAGDARPVSYTLPGDDDVKVLIRSTIFGEFMDLILPPGIKKIPDIEVVEPENRYGDREIFTGMVVDARGTGFRPAIYPLIVNEQGREVYGPLYVSREYAVEKGLCSFASSPEPTLIRLRAGERPIMIDALRKEEGEKGAVIVISLSDSHKIQRLPERHEFMKACRVVILVSE